LEFELIFFLASTMAPVIANSVNKSHKYFIFHRIFLARTNSINDSTFFFSLFHTSNFPRFAWNFHDFLLSTGFKVSFSQISPLLSWKFRRITQINHQILTSKIFSHKIPLHLYTNRLELSDWLVLFSWNVSLQLREVI
jgi:hypothetical protein